MKKVKYVYNNQTLRYEQLERSWLRIFLKIFGFLCASALVALILLVLIFKFIDSPKEKQLKREMAIMELKYEQINNRLGHYNEVLADLQKRDDDIYRVIFEAEPLPSSIRQQE